MQTKEQIINGLSYAFRNEADKLRSRDNRKGTQLYAFQVDFTYAIDSISRGAPHEAEAGVKAAKHIIGDMRSATA